MITYNKGDYEMDIDLATDYLPHKVRLEMEEREELEEHRCEEYEAGEL